MTLCGWKIFSKNKQRVKITKNDSTINLSKVDLNINYESTKVSTKVTTKIKINNELETCKTESYYGESSTKSISLNINSSPKSNSFSEEFDEDGNPRNKCALKPGHSLMDWIRYGSSGLDLTGTKGAITPISTAELAKHCKQDDAWLAIRGKVYNVTHYMEFHPGGPDELMKGVGKDATKLFDEVHAWVNYEQLLSKCYIGPLRNTVMIDLEPFKIHSKTSSANGSTIKLPILPLSTSCSAKTSPIKSNNTNNIILNNSDSNETIDIIPRFDSIQKTSDLTFVFYTKAFCNPGLVINYKSDSELDIRILIERTTHLYNFKLLHDINWPCSCKISNETGKIELKLLKTIPKLWTSYGLMERLKLNDIEQLYYEYEIGEKQQITHDSYAIALKPIKRVLIYTPIGYHLSITALVDDDNITRSYTPVPGSYLPIDCPNFYIPLLIKSYSSGILAKHITGQSLIDNSSTVLLNLSEPKGNFLLTRLKEHNRIALLAAGSGITPILSVLDYLIRRTANKLEHIELMLFNKAEEDIWCRTKLEDLAEKDERIRLRHILSEPYDGWLGEKGRISKELILPLNEQISNSYVTFCCVCGPTPFNDMSQQILKDVGFDTLNLHFFQG